MIKPKLFINHSLHFRFYKMYKIFCLYHEKFNLYDTHYLYAFCSVVLLFFYFAAQKFLVAFQPTSISSSAYSCSSSPLTCPLPPPSYIQTYSNSIYFDLGGVPSENRVLDRKPGCPLNSNNKLFRYVSQRREAVSRGGVSTHFSVRRPRRQHRHVLLLFNSHDSGLNLLLDL